MSDFGERTQPATERRRRDARARGEVARSADLVAASVLLVVMASLWWLGPSLGQMLAGSLRAGLLAAPAKPLTVDAASLTMRLLVGRVAANVTPVLLIALTMAALASLVQTGFLWTPSALVPRGERLDPARRLGRWLSADSWFALMLGVLKLAAVLTVLTAYVRARLSSAGPLVQGEPAELLGLAARMIVELGLLLALTLFALALADYGWRFWRHEQSLKMTVEEVRREQREEEANPRLKRARRDAASGVSTVPEAHQVESVRSV